MTILKNIDQTRNGKKEPWSSYQVNCKLILVESQVAKWCHALCQVKDYYTMNNKQVVEWIYTKHVHYTTGD